MIYLDSASTTAVDQDLRDLIDNYLYDNYGNAGSTHSLGIRSKKAIGFAREQIAGSLSASPEDIIFTSGGSESNTLAIVGLSEHLKKLGLTHIITTKYEHHSVLNAMKEMERRGFEVTYLDVPNGVVSYEDFEKSVRDNTGLVSIMYMNNELGTLNDVEKIYEFCKRREILFHSDCVQAYSAGIDVKLGATADMISISGHKIYAPKGVGCLATLHKEYLTNIIFGGQQEFGIRPGTENVPYIAAFGECLRNTYLYKNTISETLSHLFGRFKCALSQECCKIGLKYAFNVPQENCNPKICSVRFDGVDAQTLMLMLDKAGVCVSSGAACSSHASEPSHVLKAIGLSDDQARSTIRVSFSEYNKIDDVEKAAKIIARCANTLNMIGGGEN